MLIILAFNTFFLIWIISIVILKLKQRTAMDHDRRHWKATKALIFVMPLLGFGHILTLVVKPALASLGLLRPSRSATFVAQPPRAPEAAPERSAIHGGRRALLSAAALLGAGQSVGEAQAAATKAVTENDLKRISAGYKELQYLMENWNKVTRDCRDVDQNVQQVLASGTESPDNCKATPDIVRKYMGMRSIDGNLFNTQQLWINIQSAGNLVQDKDDERFADAVEDFERAKRQASEWAYSSSWGEANPGGGRDRVEDYLLRSKKEAAKATEALGIIVDVLRLA